MIESALSDLAGWFGDLIENVGSIGLGYLILGCLLQWGQTLLNSVAWRNVLQASYPEKHILQKEISAGYAAGVGLNSVLPGQAGTITYLALFRASISGSSVATITAGAAVQAIFWSIVGGLVYLLLFLSRPDAFDVKLGTITSWIGDHLVITLLLAAAAAAVILICVRLIKTRLREQWAQLGQGAAILRTPRRYLARVVTFQALSYTCRIGVNDRAGCRAAGRAAGRPAADHRGLVGRGGAELLDDVVADLVLGHTSAGPQHAIDVVHPLRVGDRDQPGRRRRQRVRDRVGDRPHRAVPPPAGDGARGASEQRAADHRRREQHSHGGAAQRAPARRPAGGVGHAGDRDRPVAVAADDDRAVDVGRACRCELLHLLQRAGRVALVVVRPDDQRAAGAARVAHSSAPRFLWSSSSASSAASTS
jgi:hypothetical protein